MLEKTFGTRRECQRYLDERFTLSQSKIQGATELLHAAVAACEEVGDAAGRDALEFRLGQWVIRNDDLDVLKSIRDGLFALAGAKFALVTGMTAAAVTAVLFSVVTLIRNAYRSGATLIPNVTGYRHSTRR